MRILLLNQAFYPDSVATSQHVTDLALFLKENGYDVTVVAGRRDYNHRERVYPAKELYKGIKIFRVHSTGFGKKSFFSRLVDALSFKVLLLWRLIRIPRQDVVVAFTSPPLLGYIAMCFAKLRGERCVQWLMDVNPHLAVESGYLKRNSWIAKFLYWIFNQTMKHSDHVVALDRWMRELAVSHGARSERVAIVPPWPINRLEPPKPSLNPFREKYGLEHKFVVLYSGNHSIVHPLDTLLQAAVRMREEKDVVFLFIGSGLRVKDVASYIDRYHLENVMQLPYQPREMLNYSLSAADAHVVVMGKGVSGLVHNSKVYGVLATGRPVIFVGPESSHVTDLFKDCSSGYQVSHGEVGDLVKLIGKFQERSFEDLFETGKTNLELVSKRFSGNRLMRHFADEVLLFDENRKEPTGLGSPLSLGSELKVPSS